MAFEQDYFVNLINSLIDKKLAESIHIAIGTISDYDPDLYLAKVFLQYEQVETPFVRLGGAATGNAFGDKTPPSIGDEVIVAFYGGTVETAVIISRLYSDPSDPPPIADPGDRIIRWMTGAQIAFKTSGGLEFSVSNGSARMKINPDNSMELSNDTTKILLSATGKVSLSNSTAELLDLVNQLLTQLLTASNIVAPPPSGLGTFSPSVLTQLTLIQTKLNTLKV